MDSLRDKVVLITGSSSGIGGATAEFLATLGCRLSLTGRDDRNLQAVAARCRALGLPPYMIHTVLGDVTSQQDVERIINSTITAFGQLDVLVSNAGILQVGTLETSDLDAYHKVMDINLKSCVMMARAVIPHLTKTRGNIIMVSSFSGIRPTAGCVYYAMSKSALDHMVRILSVELAPKGIRVNSVNPGVIQTDLHFRIGYTDEQYRQYMEDQKTLVPLGRHGNPEEVASVIAFLASDLSSYVTGVNLLVDGGRANSVPRNVDRGASKL